VIHTEGKGGQSGVAILLEERIAKCVTKIEHHEDRLLMVELRAYPVDITVLQVYMPTSASEEEEVDEIYEVIEEKLSNIKGRDYTIIMEDWNASVGERGEGNYIGKYGLGRRNERGQKLVDFCRRQTDCNKHVVSTGKTKKI
jgi:exonuclease III